MTDTEKINNLIKSDNFFKLKKISSKILVERNEFDIIELFDDIMNENSWSKIFSYLLNSKKNHKLGQSFLRQWLIQIDNEKTNLFLNKLPDEKNTEIETVVEWQTDENRRIDILIYITDRSHKKQSIIGIENKLDHTESTNQVSDYQKAISKTFKKQDKIIFFLTPDGRNCLSATENSDCPCLAISYQTISKTCSYIVDDKKDIIHEQVKLFLNSLKNHIEKMINNNKMEKEISDLIKEIYKIPENREAINILNDYAPTISNIFNKFESDYHENERFNIAVFYSTKTTEFKLHTKELDSLAEKIGVGFCYMLHFNGQNPEIGEEVILRLMVYNYNEYDKDKINELKEYFQFPNSLNKEKNWWQWKSIWTSDSYILQDLDKIDYKGLKNYLEVNISETYTKIEQKIQNYKTE